MAETRRDTGRRRVIELARATRESELSLEERRASAYGTGAVEQAMIDEGVPPESREERATEIRAAIAEEQAAHDCNDHAVPYVSDGPLGHGWECGLCGAFLQAG